MSSVFPINDDPRYRRYTASAGQKVFPVPFPFLQDEDLKICLQTSPSEYTVFDPADYSLSGANNPAGGTVTLDTGRSAGDVILVLGEAILDRMSSIVRDGKFSSWLIDSELDRIRIIEQEFRRDNRRSVKADYGSGGLTIDAGIEDGDTLMKEGDRLVPGPNLPALAADLITEATAQANRSHDEADRSEAARDIAAAIVNDIASEKEVPIVGVVEAMPDLNLPTGMTGIRTNGFGAMGDLGAWPLAVEVENSGDLKPWQRLTNGGARRWDLRTEVASVLMFGAAGDGRNDTNAFKNAVDWLTDKPGRTLTVPGSGRNYRIADNILADFSGFPQAGNILMEGSIKPDPGIGAAIMVRNSRGGKYRVQVNGGGQTADYSQADPSGGDEAFRFVNIYGCQIAAGGHNYKGRVLRATSDTSNLGPDGFRSQWNYISRVYCNSSARLSDVEATRLDQGVGQSFFVDSKLNAFGTISDVFLLWDMFGPVIEDTTDVTLHDMETLWRGVSGLELRGVIGFWGGKLKLGSEKVGGGITLLKIIDSATRNCQQITIENGSAIGGYNGIYAENVGVSPGQGLTIKNFVTRVSENYGIHLKNCRKFKVNAECYGDVVNMRLSGPCAIGKVDIDTLQSKRQGLVIDAEVAGGIKITGRVADGNAYGEAGVSLIDVNTTSTLRFNNFTASSPGVDYLFDLPPGNATRISGGEVVAGSGVQIIRNQPNKAIDVIGWQTANAGQITLPASATSVVVAHGLVKAPDTVVLTARGQLGGPPFAPTGTRTSSQFTINVPASVASAQSIDWVARCDYGKI